MHPANTNKQQFAVDLVGKSRKEADAFNEGALNDTFVEGFDAFLCYIPRHNWVQYPQAGQTDLSFKNELHLFIWKGAGLPTTTKNHLLAWKLLSSYCLKYSSIRKRHERRKNYDFLSMSTTPLRTPADVSLNKIDVQTLPFSPHEAQ